MIKFKKKIILGTQTGVWVGVQWKWYGDKARKGDKGDGTLYCDITISLLPWTPYLIFTWYNKRATKIHHAEQARKNKK